MYDKKNQMKSYSVMLLNWPKQKASLFSAKYCRKLWQIIEYDSDDVTRSVMGVPRRQLHRRSGLATLPSVGAVP